MQYFRGSVLAVILYFVFIVYGKWITFRENRLCGAKFSDEYNMLRTNILYRVSFACQYLGGYKSWYGRMVCIVCLYKAT